MPSQRSLWTPQTWLLSNLGALETCFFLLPCLLATKQHMYLGSEVKATAQPLLNTIKYQPRRASQSPWGLLA